MLNRRKILLALIEALGGDIKSTDMEKLLFLYCRQFEVPPYDFFPYKYGCFSLLSYQDKRALTARGYLVAQDSFTLRRKTSYLRRLLPEEQSLVRDFANRYSLLRGRSLVRHVYKSFPYYATRSEIRKQILNLAELEAVEAACTNDMQPRLFTIGYEGRSIDAYINELISRNIGTVIDVRRNALSMKYGYSKERFSSYLDRAGIFYIHMPQREKYHSHLCANFSRPILLPLSPPPRSDLFLL